MSEKKNIGTVDELSIFPSGGKLLMETGGSIRRIDPALVEMEGLGITSLSSLPTDGNLLLQDSEGVLQGVPILTALAPTFSGMFIIAEEDSDMYMVPVENWTSQAKSWTSDDDDYTVIGVALTEGQKSLVVAVDEASSAMRWNTANVDCGTDKITTHGAAFEDFDGESKTATIVANSNYVGSTDCAPGYCHAYSKGTNGYGIKAGSWWLPSLGELAWMYANKAKLNYAMSIVNGTQFSNAWYWSSTEYSATYSWGVYFANGGVYANYGKSNSYRVRQVSSLKNCVFYI